MKDLSWSVCVGDVLEVSQASNEVWIDFSIIVQCPVSPTMWVNSFLTVDGKWNRKVTKARYWTGIETRENYFDKHAAMSFGFTVVFSSGARVRASGLWGERVKPCRDERLAAQTERLFLVEFQWFKSYGIVWKHHKRLDTFQIGGDKSALSPSLSLALFIFLFLFPSLTFS